MFFYCLIWYFLRISLYALAFVFSRVYFSMFGCRWGHTNFLHKSKWMQWQSIGYNECMIILGRKTWPLMKGFLWNYLGLEGSIDLFHGRRCHWVAWQNPRNLHMRNGWLVNEDNFERETSLRNCPHLPTTQCASRLFQGCIHRALENCYAKFRSGGATGMIIVKSGLGWRNDVFSESNNYA
jgi:hypothetical protein